MPRVHKLIDKATWTTRIQHIRDFEALLAENGTTILKFFLHISKEEQLARFAQRLDDPNRNWKISESDYTERALWDDYIEAFEDVIRATSTKDAPWYVIPVEPQVVSQSRGVADHGRHDGGAEARLPAALGRPRRTSGASITPRSRRRKAARRSRNRASQRRHFHNSARNDKEGAADGRECRRSTGTRVDG